MHGQIAKCRSERTPSRSTTRTENGRIEKSNHNDRPRTQLHPGRDAPRTGIRSANVQHVCVIICSCQPSSVLLFNGCVLVKKMLQKLPCINRLLKELVVFSNVIRDVKDKTFDSTSVFRYYKIQAFDLTSACQFGNYI